MMKPGMMDLEAMKKRAMAINLDHGSYDHAGEMARMVQLLIDEVERLKKLVAQNWEFHESMRRERDEAREKLAELEQTCGDLCEKCGWSTVLAGDCMKCERDEARGVLERFLAYKPFEQRFNHSGAMNATQLAERDKYVEIHDMAVKALTGGRE